ncbi:MAG TPA: tetratricopeptide repeat protein [Blastocatellia bacterium]
MKTISALIFACCFALTTFSQQLTLNGSLIEDSDKGKHPVPTTRVSVHGIENTTDPKGQFKLVLPSGFSEGELVIIKVIKPNCVINHPLDGKWNLPNIKLQNIQTLEVIIVPKGSWALLSEERRNFLLSKFKDQFTNKIGALTRQNVALRSELAASQTDAQALRTEILSDLLNQWQQEYGLSVEGIKAVLDKYASTRSNSDNNRTKGLKAYYNGNFEEADAYFGKAGLEDEEDIKQIEEELERKKLSAFNNFKDQGESRSSSYNFIGAINSYDHAAKFVTKEKRPQEWAEIELLSGNAQVELGISAEGEEGRKLLKEAVQRYQNALQVYTRQQSPQDWAMMQNNLGIALKSQGERMAGDEGVKLLAEAVMAYDNSLQVYSREQFPQQWAATQNNLGIVLSAQGVRMAGAVSVNLLAEAVSAFRSSLLIRTREQFPQQGAATQNNLGIVLSAQGVRTPGAVSVNLLAGAVSAFRDVLMVYTREQFPQRWAMVQHNLGIALTSQGERTAGAVSVNLLAGAASAFRDALMVYTREQFPQQWGATQNDLGNVLQRQGERIEGVEGVKLLDEAAAAHRNALLVRTREQLPQQWAMTKLNLGTALGSQGARMAGKESVKLLAGAVNALRDALLVYTREQFPQPWAMTQNNLGNALRLQGERIAGEEGVMLLAEAITAYRNALLTHTREQLPQQWAMTQNSLGNALSSQGERIGGEKGVKLLAEAVATYRSALQVYTRENFPRDWAGTQNNLGDAHYLLGEWSKAAECYANLLTLYPNEQKPYQRLSGICHERLFKFELAFILSQKWLTNFPNDLSVLPDFAEQHFTTGRFAECQKRVTMLIAQPELDAGVKIALRLIEIANLLALGQAQQVPARLNFLSRAIEAQPAEFKIEWMFNGTLHFIGQEDKLATYREWLNLLFSAAEGASREAVLKALHEARASFKP